GGSALAVGIRRVEGRAPGVVRVVVRADRVWRDAGVDRVFHARAERSVPDHDDVETGGRIGRRHRADRGGDADLQRGSGARIRGGAGDLRVVAGDRANRGLRVFPAQRFGQPQPLDRGGGFLAGADPAIGRAWADFVT